MSTPIFKLAPGGTSIGNTTLETYTPAGGDLGTWNKVSGNLRFNNNGNALATDTATFSLYISSGTFTTQLDNLQFSVYNPGNDNNEAIGITFGYVDANNYWKLAYQGSTGNILIVQIVSGSATTIASAASGIANASVGAIKMTVTSGPVGSVTVNSTAVTGLQNVALTGFNQTGKQAGLFATPTDGTNVTVAILGVEGDQVASSGATAYTLTAPQSTSGSIGVASGNFTIQANGTPSSNLVVTMASTKSATFTPSTLTISDSSPHTFTVTPTQSGTDTISVTHSGGGFSGDPTGISYTVAAPAGATAYTLTAPQSTSGTVGIASGNFTIQANGTPSSNLIVTVASTKNATITTSPITISDAGTHTFTVTPTQSGSDTISVTHTGGGFSGDPTGISYTAAVPTPTISPTVASVALNGTQQFTTTNLTSPTWTVSGVGSVNSSGLYTAGSTAGSATVTATSGGQSVNASVTVFSGRSVISSVVGFAGGLSTVGYTVYDASGSVLHSRSTSGVGEKAPGTYAAVVVISTDACEVRWDNGTGASASDFVQAAGSSSSSSGSFPTVQQIADAVLAESIEPGETLMQTIRIVRAVLAGKATDSNGTSTFKRGDGTTTALTVIHDQNGNRTLSSTGTLS